MAGLTGTPGATLTIAHDVQPDTQACRGSNIGLLAERPARDRPANRRIEQHQMSDAVTNVYQSAFVALHDGAQVRFGTLVGAFVRFRGSSLGELSECAGVTRDHIEACIYLRALPSRAVRDCFARTLGFDPWQIVSSPNGAPVRPSDITEEDLDDD